MTQLDEAIARYHRLIESDKYRNLEWAEALQEQIAAKDLSGGEAGFYRYSARISLPAASTQIL